MTAAGKSFQQVLRIIGLLAALSFAVNASTAEPAGAARKAIEDDGTLHVPAFDLPISGYMSDVAKATFINNIKNPKPIEGNTISQYRETMDVHLFRPMAEKSKAAFPVDIEEKQIGGVRSFEVTPKGGVSEENRNRLLINLHGGGMVLGGGEGCLGETIPIAGTGKIRVICMDYRMAPEHLFPAATDDIVAVYRELIKRFEPKNIGIYGCSAGGSLTAQTVARLLHDNVPLPAAVGMFCSPGKPSYRGGDAMTLYQVSMGELSTGRPHSDPTTTSGTGIVMHLDDGKTLAPDYMSEASLKDPLAYPNDFLDVVAKFPPTLFIVGGRERSLSASLHEHNKFTLAGVDSRLHSWDGMWHTFLYDPDLPEAREGYTVITRFFASHLGK